MKNLIKYIVLFLSFAWMVLVIAVLPSCTPQKRLDRLLRNHPELLNRVDTVHFTDTFIVQKISLDTVFSTDFDTVKIVRDCVRVRLIRHRDTLRLTVDKPADTIYKPLKIPVKTITAEIKPSLYESFIICFIVICLLLLLIYGFLRLPRKTDGEYYNNK